MHSMRQDQSGRSCCWKNPAQLQCNSRPKQGPNDGLLLLSDRSQVPVRLCKERSVSTDGLDQLRLFKAWVPMAVRCQPRTICSSASRRVERFELSKDCLSKCCSVVCICTCTDNTLFTIIMSGTRVSIVELKETSETPIQT